MYSRILVALDGTPESEHALRHALPVAKATGAELILVRTVAPPTTMDEAEAQRGHLLEAEAEAQGYLRRHYETLEAEGVPCRILVPRGEPVHGLLRVAQEEAVDLVVLSSYSESGFDRWVHGSVPGRLLEAWRGALLLVRPAQSA